MKKTETIKLGFISGLSGVYSWSAQNQLQGVILATQEMNKNGGIDGRQIEIIIRDDETKPELAAKLTRKLIQEDKADFIIGGLSADTQLWINKETRAAGKIFMSLGQSNDLTKAQNLGPYTFHHALTPYMTVQGTGKWVFENLGKDWFIIVADYAWGQAVQKDYENLSKRMGARCVGVAKTPFPLKGKEDIMKHVPEILRKKPEVLIGANYGAEQLIFMEVANKMGLKRKMSIVNTLSEINVIERVPPEEAVGMYWGVSFYWGLADILPAAKKFVSAYQRRFRQVPSSYSAYGYSGACEIFYAIRKLGTYPIDAAAVSRELEGRTFSHYKTPEWWRPCDHQAFQDHYILKLKGTEERKNKNDISEIIGTTSWELDFERTCEDLGHKKNTWGHIDPPPPSYAN